MNEQELKSLAAKYNLDAAFVGQLYDKLTDKTTIEKALRMFVAGTLKFDVATGRELPRSEETHGGIYGKAKGHP